MIKPEEREFQHYLQIDLKFWQELAAHHQELANDPRITPQEKINNTWVFDFALGKLSQLLRDDPYSLEDDPQGG